MASVLRELGYEFVHNDDGLTVAPRQRQPTKRRRRFRGEPAPDSPFAKLRDLVAP